MKENKKLISEILADVRHDMTDEEILNLLASSRISVNPEKESGKLTSLVSARRTASQNLPEAGHSFFHSRAYCWRG